MKKISLLLLFITLFSACNKEESINNIVDHNHTSKPSKSAIQVENVSLSKSSNSIGQNSRVITVVDEQLLSVKLNTYAYVIGKMFRENFAETKTLIASAIEYNQNGQAVVKLGQLINTNGVFRSKITHQLYSFYGLDDITMRGNTRQPPIPDAITALIPQTMPIVLEEVTSGNLQDNIELYIARDINFHNPYNFINIGAHPLSLPTFSFSIYLFSDGPVAQNATMLFTPNFISNHNENVLIVRPYRDASHSYNNIYVDDFTIFYN